MERSDSLEELRKLTYSLPAFPDLVNCSDGVVEYKMETGTCLGWCIFKTDSIGVHRWYNSAGTIFPEHAHDEWEMIVVYEGTLILHSQGEKNYLKETDFFINEPNVKHWAEFPEECRYVTITIPPSKEFPD